MLAMPPVGNLTIKARFVGEMISASPQARYTLTPALSHGGDFPDSL